MKLLVTDLEATCCDKETIPRDESEIIEIGSVLVDFNNGKIEIIDEFQTFIKPVIHHQLTDFCVDLTKITQKMVDESPEFKEAYANFDKWIKGHDEMIFASWGGYDARQFIRSCTKHNTTFMFNKDDCLNLKELYAKNKPLSKKRGIGLGRALKMEGLEFIGSPHRGIDDAKNIARLLDVCMKGY